MAHQTLPKPKPHRLIKAARKRAQAKADRLVYQAVDKRDGNCCTRCGVFGIERHHRVFRSRGGKTTLANIVSLCEKCHRKAHGR